MSIPPTIRLLCLVTALLFIPTSFLDASVIETLQGFQSTLAEITAGDTAGYRQGAGVVVRPDGHVITNLHVVQGAPRITVRLQGQRPRAARIVKIYPDYDVIVLKIDSPVPLPHVALAPSGHLKLHQTVYHIGSSYLLNKTISEGRITGLGMSKQDTRLGNHEIDILRLNIQAFRGDSGGPLFNQEGQLVGLMVAKDTKRPRVSFAIPVNKIKKILSDI